MGFGNILTHLYNQMNPFFPGSGSSSSSQYTCQGYTADSKALEFMNEVIPKDIEMLKKSGIDPFTNPGHLRDLALREQIQKCLSDAGNVLLGGSNNEPSLGLYIGIGAGIAAGIGGLAWYLKSRSKKSEKTSQ